MNEEEINKMCSDIYEGEDWQPMKDYIKSLQTQLQQKENIIKEVRNWVKSTIDIIKQQPTGNDEWILERLNSFISLLDKGE